MAKKDEIKSRLMEKYKEKLQEKLGAKLDEVPEKITSAEYDQFKKESIPTHMGWYEKGCNFTEKILKCLMSVMCNNHFVQDIRSL